MAYIGNEPAEAYSNIAYQDFGTQSGTTFTLDYPAGAPGELEVFVNNVRQEPSVAYTVSGTTLTMTGTIASTDDFYVVFQGKAQQTVRHPANTALEATTGTFSGALSATTGTFSGAVSMGANNITFSNGSGIDFSASAGSGASSSILDDYEEGTWVPVFADATSGGNVSSTSATEATYIKIGSLVAVTCKATNISDSGLTSSNSFYLRGLPYVSQGRSMNSIFMQNVDVGTNPVDIIARIVNGVQYMQFEQINDDSTRTVLTVAAFNDGPDLQISMTYQTTF